MDWIKVVFFCLLSFSSVASLSTSFGQEGLVASPVSLGSSVPGPACDRVNYSCDGCDAFTDSQDNWFLMRTLSGTHMGDFLRTRRIQVYGWTEGSFTASSASRNQLPMGFNYRANDFVMNQNWLRVERVVETDSNSPSFGFLADTILPGSDYRFTLARGLADDQTGSHGIDPVQFYAQMYFPNVAQGLDLKMGRFFGQYGVESIAAVETPFVSRAYNFIYNPFTHTGLLATLQLNDNWSVQNGIVTGSDIFFDSASEPTYIGSVNWESDSKDTSILLATIFGSGRFNQAEDFANPRVFNLVFSQKLIQDLTYTLDALYGYQTDVPGIGTANWYAFVNYLNYQWSERWSGTTRLEFFNDIDGDRTGFEGLYTALTTGLTYKPRNGILIRPELRYDYNDSSRPFEDKSGLFTAACGMIVRW
ncbi:outer membrane beta-barrel protein [Pirellulaceae bacterium SH449]